MIDATILNATFLPTEGDAPRHVLENISGRHNGKNIPNIAADLAIGRGVVRVVIKRAVAAGLVQLDSAPIRYFVL